MGAEIPWAWEGVVPNKTAPRRHQSHGRGRRETPLNKNAVAKAAVTSEASLREKTDKVGLGWVVGDPPTAHTP